MFEKQLQILINQFNKESESNTPDFILSQYIEDCLNAYSNAILNRDKYYNVDYNFNKEFKK